jgi:hypothetical protein
VRVGSGGLPQHPSFFWRRRPVAITSAQSYAKQIEREGEWISDPPALYTQTVQRLLAEHGTNYVAHLLAFALRDLDRLQGKAS